MSLGVQAIQILRVYGGRFVFAVIIGPQVLINFVTTPGSIPIGGPRGSERRTLGRRESVSTCSRS
jgi:hypothetical protein